MRQDAIRTGEGERPATKWLQWIGIGAFVCALWLPIVQMIFPVITEYLDMENRELAEPPSLPSADWTRLIPDTEAYLNDRFGLRTVLIRWNSILRVGLLDISPIPNVVVGKGGWLFYRSEAVGDGNSLNDYRGFIPLPVEELEGLRQRILDNERIFSEMSIPYLVVIVPNKHTIYGEYLPDQTGPPGAETRLQQFMDYLHDHPLPDDCILDLRGPLQEAKRNHPVYWKTDSHWNSYGAYIGYREIMNRLADHDSSLAPLSIRNHRVDVIRAAQGGDLSQMLLMRDLMPEPNDTRLKLAPLSHNVTAQPLLLRHDSFGDGLYPYLELHFENIHNIAPFAPFPFKEIAAEHPLAVVHVFAERYLTQALHDDFFYREMHRP